jgi:hypothetical protein
MAGIRTDGAQDSAHTEEVIMDNPAGGIRRGWEEIQTVYMQIFSQIDDPELLARYQPAVRSE